MTAHVINTPRDELFKLPLEWGKGAVKPGEGWPFGRWVGRIGSIRSRGIVITCYHQFFFRSGVVRLMEDAHQQWNYTLCAA